MLGNCTSDIACPRGMHGNAFGRPFAGINSCIPCVSDEAWFALDFKANMTCQPYLAQTVCPDNCLASNRPHLHPPAPTSPPSPSRESEAPPASRGSSPDIHMQLRVSAGLLLILAVLVLGLFVRRKRLRNREDELLFKKNSFTQSPFSHPGEADPQSFPNHSVDSLGSSPYRNQPPYRDQPAAKPTVLNEVQLIAQARPLNHRDAVVDIKQSFSGDGGNVFA